MEPPESNPPHCEHGYRLPVYLPFKYIIFKNAFPNGDWDQSNCFTFDIPTIPFLKNARKDVNGMNNYDNLRELDTLYLLQEFCPAALNALQDYLLTLNNNNYDTPEKCKWVIHTVDIGKDEHGILSSQEFGVVLEMIGWEKFVDMEEKIAAVEIDARTDKSLQPPQIRPRLVAAPGLAPAPAVWIGERDGQTWFRNPEAAREFGLPVFP
ncbi:hypothetical protein TWF506_011089 [Arthrobotrys conoides]|uniref:Uncharacterized protein n=1 Tax=Arthrobotrys conoides TaxID=74498 RepID=A0AAN8NFZ6_9PEZI